LYNPNYSANPPTAPSPPPPPPTEEAEEPTSAPRYPYLVARLRNRQITMEEATELFAIQRRQVQALLVRTNALTAAAAASPTPVRMPRPTPRTTEVSPAAMAALENLDLWGEGLIFLAVGAGLLAAVAKRFQGPPPGSPPAEPRRPAPSASGSRRS
jgi:hypothetical protein